MGYQSRTNDIANAKKYKNAIIAVWNHAKAPQPPVRMQRANKN